ncbi:MAG TPA: VOC family protein [Candidatus Rubrimentiphilum sp.]|nr:VOC family protein [Candidatus Rubrimentiphilum sp.]
MELQPYIFFYGRCAEALEFYKKALGGTYESSLVKDSPMRDQMPPGSDERVMHATFSGKGLTFMASDGNQTKPVDPEAGNIALSLGTTDAAEGERIFNALSEDGDVKMPIAEAFWGGKFGIVVDKFGTEWMLTLP